MNTFRQLIKLASGALSVTVIAVTLTAPAGAATTLATTWSVSPGGTFTGKATTSTFEDTKTGATITCTSATIAGDLKSGTGLPGKGLGTVTSLTFSSCTLAGMSYSLSSGPAHWSLNAGSFNPKSGGFTYGTLTGVHLVIAGSNCSAVVDGTSGTADNGKVKFSYNNKTRHFKIPFNGDALQVWDVDGCLGLLTNGDGATIGSCPVVVPPQVITGSGGPGRRPDMTGPPCR